MTANRKAGYSLFEVLIAFAIMSMVLATLIPGQAKLIGRAASIDEQTLAQDFAFSRLATIGVVEPIVVGEHRTSYRNWIIIENVTEYAFEGFELEGYLISASVLNASGRQIAKVTQLKVADGE